ncbi:hypothetical protein, partial [Paraburkholderia sediminicola]|uniref:hypothetical protein n=1 Tax=Paraburkholderia sediminicola TaxID=458836 RepID=UPI0038BDAD09
RGNANRPLTMQGKAPKPEQGKANALRTLTTSAAQANSPTNSHSPKKSKSAPAGQAKTYA